ncbi:thiamine pyrophosphate-binding protein [Burkholderia pyrrocinia]|uniref:thiamine pyrophosphate-binding protein n=1 Tax=Burkholderia pyrrocinia TaxID=60550 RepID=UPI00215B3AC9|nr:thiamine pyrophosphate-binding protein [Burkholderia pyrrocinia]UVE69154.1 thiamine pyrophosphate-binding protein [Burkholderia pyrrocinia]
MEKATHIPARCDVSGSVMNLLRSLHIDHIFLVPGKMVYPLLDAMDKMPEMRGIVAAHETGSAFMADGYARASRKFGVCLAISGPGTMNLVPGMAAALADRIPVLYLAGGISSNAEGKGAFQDGTLGGIAESSVVQNLVDDIVELKNKHNLLAEMRRATDGLNWMRRARSFISIPLDVQQQPVPVPHDRMRRPYAQSIVDMNHVPANPVAVQALCKQYLFQEKKVAFLVGGRGNDPETAKVLLKVAERFNIPVATTLSGKGAFPERHPLALGVYGFSGHTRAVQLINSTDLDALVVLGCDLNQRDSLNWSDKLSAGKELVIFDDSFDAPATGHVPSRSIFSGITATIRMLSHMQAPSALEFQAAFAHRDEWLEHVKQIPLYDHRFEPTSIGSASNSLSLYPGDVVRRLCDLVPDDTNVVVDSGAHRIFMAHYWLSTGLGNYFSSSALAPMGWAVAAGIGVKLAAPQRPCLVVTGDGCMLMHGMEIQTAARYGIKVIFIVLNNSAHGAIHIDAITKRTVAEQFSKLPRHDWTQFAQSVGVPARQVDCLTGLEQAIDDALACSGPFVIEVAVGVFPSPNRYYAESSTATQTKNEQVDAFSAPHTAAIDAPECID